MNYFGIAMKYNDAVELDHWLTTSYPHVLLETVAQDEETHRRTDETRCFETSGDLDRVEQERAIGILLRPCLRIADLSNAHLEKQGLTSIRTLWIKIHYPATAR